MKKGKEWNATFFSAKKDLAYLPPNDHYLSTAPCPKYRFNLIGAGMMGQEHMAVTMLEGRATVHGVYDPQPLSVEQAQKVYSQNNPPHDLVVYPSLQAACNDPKADGLIVCTPNHTHIAIVREAIQSGKHILLEKPMATTLEDAHEIVCLAQNYDAVFQIGLQYRYKAIYVEARHEALTRQSIGAIKTISILEHRLPFLDKVDQWNKFSQYSGGTLVEKCCHYFDLLNLFAQAKPQTVYSTGSRAVNFLDFEYDNKKSDIIDNAFVTIVYENGIRAHFNLCMFAPMFYEELTLCGDEGHLKAFETEDFLPTLQNKNHLQIRCGATKPSRTTTPSYPQRVEASGHNGSTYLEHVHFVDNIEGKKTDTPQALEGFWATVVGVAAEQSLKTGNLVQISDLLKALDLSKIEK